MKRILFFAALVATVFFTSCKKEKTPEELLVGKWKVTKMVADGEDIIAGDPTLKTAVELEFTNAGSMIFNVTELDLSVTPAEESKYTLAGSYTFTGDNVVTFSYTDGTDSSAVTGNLDITTGKFTFVATSGDIEDFIQIIEADKI